MLLHGLGVYAQQKGYTFEVAVSEQWEKTDGNKIIFPQRLPGAVISIISPSDTLVATTDDSGRCLFRKIADRYIQVRVQHMGYSANLSTIIGLMRSWVSGSQRVVWKSICRGQLHPDFIHS